MGRTEKSQGLAPPAIRKDARAKQARHIINKVIPALLASNARARNATENSELIADPGRVAQSQVEIQKNAKSRDDQDGSEAAYVKRKGQGKRKLKRVDGEGEDLGEELPLHRGKAKGRRRNDSLEKPFSTLDMNDNSNASTSALNTTPPARKIRILTTDTITAAQLLSTSHQTKSKHRPNTCILNMASPLRPGGGVLSGATSQEEFLCARTTLLPSLHESFYRLPEYGGVWSSDVLVFRSAGPLASSAQEFDAKERFWVDVVSAGMLRFPELEGEEDEIKRLGKKDRETVQRKMRSVLRILETRGVERVVLGAWGCGAYGNPVLDVAEAWRVVLQGGFEAGSHKKKGGKGVSEAETWPQLKEVVFAINNRRMAEEFGSVFGLGVERGPGANDDEDEEEDGEDAVAEELRTKITEMEGQISKVWNPDLKARMDMVLEGLRGQLKERQGDVEGTHGADSQVESEEESDSDFDSGDAGVTLENFDEDDEDDGESTEGDIENDADRAAQSKRFK